MESLGYRLSRSTRSMNLKKEDLSIEFGAMETLEAFSGVPEKLTRKRSRRGQVSSFQLPSNFSYLPGLPSQDSYRNDNNNHKDFAKIAYLGERMT